MKKLDGTDLAVSPLALGGNTFGWTCDRDESFAVLDAYRELGGNFVDTADQYSSWVPGNSGGESETIIGEWLSRRTDRDDIILATKCGRTPGLEGLAPENIRTCVEASLRRLGVEHIDLYFAHVDDPTVPIEDIQATFDELVRAGKVRHIAASNFSADRFNESLEVSRANGWSQYVAVETLYNLVERSGYGRSYATLSSNTGNVVPAVLRARERVPDRHEPPRPPSRQSTRDERREALHRRRVPRARRRGGISRRIHSAHPAAA